MRETSDSTRREVSRPAAADTGPSKPPSVLSRVGSRIFPVRTGPLPPWSRVVSLILLMAIIWEVMWIVTFWSTGASHNLAAAWSQASKLLPVAVVLATVGAVPGFWFMRRRMQAANLAAGLPANGLPALAARRALRTPRAPDHASSRGRRRHSERRRTRR